MASLQNALYFPCFSDLPLLDEMDANYYQETAQGGQDRDAGLMWSSPASWQSCSWRMKLCQSQAFFVHAFTAAPVALSWQACCSRHGHGAS